MACPPAGPSIASAARLTNPISDNKSTLSFTVQVVCESPFTSLLDDNNRCVGSFVGGQRLCLSSRLSDADFVVRQWQLLVGATFARFKRRHGFPMVRSGNGGSGTRTRARASNRSEILPKWAL